MEKGAKGFIGANRAEDGSLISRKVIVGKVGLKPSMEARKTLFAKGVAGPICAPAIFRAQGVR